MQHNSARGKQALSAAMNLKRFTESRPPWQIGRRSS
jgi:hypothetical protein